MPYQNSTSDDYTARQSSSQYYNATQTTEGGLSPSPNRQNRGDKIYIGSQQQQHSSMDVDDQTAGMSTMQMNRAISPENSPNEALDRKFYTMMLEIDKRY